MQLVVAELLGAEMVRVSDGGVVQPVGGVTVVGDVDVVEDAGDAGRVVMSAHSGGVENIGLLNMP